MRVGWFKPAHAKSADSHRLRSALLARKRLIDIRRHMENQLRNIIKTSGAILGSTAGRGLLKKVEMACEKDPALELICRPLMTVIATARAQATEYDRMLRSMARQDSTARRMMTVPGIGVMTALALSAPLTIPRGSVVPQMQAHFSASHLADIRPAKWTGRDEYRSKATVWCAPTYTRLLQF